MATKEDILEQIVEEYLIHEGYFVRHNVKFRPSDDHPDYDKQKDSNHSDIDVIGYHPRKEGADRVVAVSCKSWQGGFNPATEVANIENDRKVRGRESWKGFRELVVPKWSEAFVNAVENATNQRQFVYVTAVTAVRGNRERWEQNQDFRNALAGNPIRILDLRQILDAISPTLTTTLAGTEVGRMLQLFKAADLLPESKTE